jgi:hypothetical protein
MYLHESTFEYLKPTDAQLKTMEALRAAAKDYATFIDVNLPDGADKTYILRKIREIAMWVNVAITRQMDGKPRA